MVLLIFQFITTSTKLVYQFGNIMSKRAEQAAERAYPHTKLPNGVVFCMSAQQVAYKEGYEQAEKDTIERVCEWLSRHYDIDLVRFRKAMEEEQ